MVEPRSEHLVNVALRLFYTHGFHATGIDRILDEAGVAKMTLYKHFRSKDQLILAALKKRDEVFREWLTTAMEQAGKDPKAKMLAMFDALDDWFHGRALGTLGFHGCAFIKAAGEFDSFDHPAHIASAEHKQLIVDYLSGLARAAGARDPETLAEQFALLKEGAIVTAQIRGIDGVAQQAKQIAKQIIDAAVR
ncbi:TetR/AcrR family transcriptional regulator [Neorhizobium sp. P12A]|uniref:TetR/AcrR family transcriptional regulator n=1 Tax=Neorhizobium sp. P12A TaxID=2268027 RepID=UPI0011EFD7C4|nr:TetR/AcrR family transcriptional regulator [Neorhizobium sp. P12A]KAA0686914.1 TetR/AcrR family transcriptional regulator [Neorhizobium sp. P12A]